MATYTESYWKCDLHNLLHFLSLRMDDHAQQEIRDYARTIGYEVVAKWCPVTWEAFLDYRVHAASFTRLELKILEPLMQGDRDAARARAEGFGWLKSSKKGGLRRNRERQEFKKKLAGLGLSAPW